jgi:hypothetical protein
MHHAGAPAGHLKHRTKLAKKLLTNRQVCFVRDHLLFHSGRKLAGLFIALVILSVSSSRTSSTPALVYVIVNSQIYGPLENSINQYTDDLKREGMDVRLHIYTKETPEDIRTLLQKAHPEGLVGCLLVGDTPYATYEMYNAYPLTPQPTYEQFPIDVFYMNLEGTWTDSDGNGKYETHRKQISSDMGWKT